MLLICSCAFAQIPGLSLKPQAGSDTPVETTISDVIDIGEIPRRLLDESLFLQQAAERTPADDKLDALEQRLDHAKRSVNSLGVKISRKDFETLPYSGLEALQRHLQFLDKTLSKLQAQLQLITRPLSAEAGELAQRRKLWLETRRQSAGFIAQDLLSDIDALNRQFAQVANDSSKPLSRLLDLGRETSALQDRTAKYLSLIGERTSSIDRELWNADADTLLHAFSTAGTQTQNQSQDSVQSVVSSFTIQNDFMKAYGEAARTRHVLIGLLALLSLPVFIYFSRKTKRIISDDTSLDHHHRTLSRPISAWLLFSSMVVLAFDFDGPWFHLRTLMALAWLPVMRLQPKWIREHFGRAIYATALFFAVNFAGQMITIAPLEYRLVLLVNGLLVVGALSWLGIRLFRSPPANDSRARMIALLFLAAIVTMLTIAIVANVLGGVNLAALLTEAALNNLYLALFLCSARALIHAYADVLIHSREQSATANSKHTGRLFEAAFTLVNIALGLAWLIATLNSLRIDDFVKTHLAAIAGFSIEIGSISLTIGGVVLFLASVYLSFWIARTIRSVLSEDVLPKMTLPRGVANSVSTMSYYSLLMLGLLVALTAAGFQMSQLALVVGALSVGIGFGLNTVINNFVSGLILMIERPIQPGDTIELSGTMGNIRDIGIRTTTITTFDGADVLVPNGLLLSEKLTNWTLSNRRRRIDVPVGVTYDCSPREVHALLLDVARKTPGVSVVPEPTVLFLGFGDSSLNFSVRAWADDFDQSAILASELALSIHTALTEAGIEIPFPQRDLHIRSIDAGVVAAVTPSARNTRAERET